MKQPKQGWPKDQCRELFHSKGEGAARKRAEELKIANHRKERWLREFAEEAPAKKVPAKAPAKKTTAKKKAPAKKATAA